MILKPSCLLPMSRAFAFLQAGLLAGVGCMGMASLSGAQTPTPQQLDMYRNLSPEQQRAILDSLGRGGASTTTNRPLEFPQTVTPRERDTEPTIPGEVRIASGDTLIL